MNMLERIKKNNFVKNIMMVASGTAFAQILTIAFSPIITRIYPPQEYGILSVYLSILTILSIGASLDYQKAIPIAANERSAYNLIVLAFLILISFVTILTLVFLFWGAEILNLLNIHELLAYRYWIPIGVFFVGSYTIILHWSLRVKDFRTITRTKITQSVFANFSKVVLGLIGLGPMGLIWGQIIGQSGGITRLSMPLIRKKDSFIKSIKMKKMKKMSRRYMKFPLFSAPSNYVYTSGTHAPVIILTSLFGTSVSGFYGLANSIVNLPITLLAMSVSQVFYSEAASIGKNDPGRIQTLLKKLSGKLAIVGLLPLIVFVTTGPWLFSFVFGSNWYQAGIYAQVIALIGYAHFVILPCGRVLEIMEMQNVSLVINVFRLLLIFGAFMTANFLNLSPVQTVIAYAIVSISSYLSLFLIVQWILTKASRRIKTNNL